MKYAIPFILFLAALPLHSAEPDPKALFVQGNAAFNAGDFVAAADLFRQAWAAKPSWKLLYNIGQAEAAAKRYGLALDAFENYLAEGGDEIDNERNNTVMDEIRRMRMLVGSVEVDAPNGAELFVDGASRGVAPFGVVRIEIGLRQVVIRLDGVVIHEAQTKIAGGVTTKIVAKAPTENPTEPPPAGPSDKEPGAETPTAAPADRPVEEHPAKDGPSPLLVAGWTLTGLGAAALIVGGVMGGLALSGESALADDCPEQVCTDADLQDDIDAVTLKANLSTALLIGGGALAATGAVLLIVGFKKRKSESAVQLLPRGAPGFAGLTLEGRF